MPTRALRHRARRPAARLPARRPGHPGRGDHRAARCARSTPPSTGRSGRCPSRGWSTPPSTSRCCSSCARCSPPSSRSPARPSWAAQEFEHLIDHVPPPRQDPWRRTSGIHKAKGRRALAAVRELWTTRDEIAQQRDTTPGRLVPDSALIAAANAMPTSTAALLDTPGFHGRGARRYADRWLAALERARRAARQRAAPADRSAPTGRRRRGSGPSATRSPPPAWPPRASWSTPSPRSARSRSRTC